MSQPEKQYDNTNRGFAGKNTHKVKDSQPDYTGRINVEGKEFWLNMWLDESEKMGKYLSASVRPIEAQDSDDIPF